MSRIEELVERTNPEGVEYRALGEVCCKGDNIKWSQAAGRFHYIDLASVDLLTHAIGETQLIDASNAPSRAQQLVKKDDVLFATTRPTQMRVCRIDEKYDGQICSTGFCVLRPNQEIVSAGWLVHMLGTAEFQKYLEDNQTRGNYPAISNKKLLKYRIPIPPLEVQEEIVQVLDSFAELEVALEAELEAELTARRLQYAHYRDQLLDFREREDVSWLTLGEVAAFTYGVTAKAKEKGDVRFVRITDISESGRLNLGDGKYLDLRECDENYFLGEGDLLVARTGATYGKTLWMEQDFPAVYASFLIKIDLDNGRLLNRFYWHFAKSTQYWTQANLLVGGGAQPQFNTKALKRIRIPLPPLAEQQRIVSILDRFDALTTSLTDGLPAEIETRRQQYAYWRDRLLDFPAKPAD